MASSQTVKHLASRYEKVNYVSKPRAYRYRTSNGNDPYQMKYEHDPYSQQQNFLYKRAIFGLSVYDKEEIEAMHWQKRKRIQKVHKRTQKELNLWKQEIVNEWTNKFFITVFPNNSFTDDLVKGSFVDPEFKNDIPFMDLGISKAQIVDKLVSIGILPSNFYVLDKT